MIGNSFPARLVKTMSPTRHVGKAFAPETGNSLDTPRGPAVYSVVYTSAASPGSPGSSERSSREVTHAATKLFLNNLVLIT
jgi:hypothetical protein